MDDEEIFVEASLLPLGKLFETKMKAHLESLKCIWAWTMARVLCAAAPSSLMEAATSGEEAEARDALTPTGSSNSRAGERKEQKTSHRKTFLRRGKISSKETCVTSIGSVYSPSPIIWHIHQDIPIVHLLPEVISFYPSTIDN